MEFQLNKGMAMAIRAIFNIDPDAIQERVNTTIKQAEDAFVALHSGLKNFDTRLVNLESTVEILAEQIGALTIALNEKGMNDGKSRPSQNRLGIRLADDTDRSSEINGHDTSATG